MITSYKELTISKYKELRKILDEPRGELDLQANVIAVLCDMSVEDVYALPLTKYEDLVRKTAFIINKPQLNGRIPDKVKIGEMVCEFTKNTNKLTAGQYIDYQTYVSKPEKEQDIAAILSCFLVPKGMKYCDGYDVVEIISWLNEHMSMYDALNVCFFFRKKSLKSIKRSLIYLESMMRVMRRKEKNQEAMEKMEIAIKDLQALRKSLQESGDGLLW